MTCLALPRSMAWDVDSARALRQRAADDIGAEIMTTMARGSAVLRLSAQAYNRLEDYERLARLPERAAVRCDLIAPGAAAR